MSVQSSATTSSHRPFLSGEADPNIQSQREKRLNDLVTNLSLSTDTPSAATIKGGPRIEIIEEQSTSDSEDSRRHSSSGVLDVEKETSQLLDQSGDNSDHGPPPISLVEQVENHRSLDENGFSSVVPTSREGPEPPSLMEQMMAEAVRARSAKEKRSKQKERDNATSASFGLKKGFLNSTPKSNSGASGRKKNGTSRKKTKKVGGFDGFGLQKGFLNKSQKVDCSEKPCKETSSEDNIFQLDSKGNLVKESNPDTNDIPTIRPKSRTQASKDNRLRMEEVQEAMRNSPLERLANGEWATPDLMEKVTSNPRLVAGLSNPKFTAALESLQKNPRETMAKFKDHPEVVDFLNEFCGVMGEHFMKLGAEQDQLKGKTGASGVASMGPLAEHAVKMQAQREAEGSVGWEKAMSREERENLDSVMANRELTELLMDANLQQVIQECSFPGRMQMFMQDPDYGPKLRKLVDAGLLKVEH